MTQTTTEANHHWVKKQQNYLFFAAAAVVDKNDHFATDIQPMQFSLEESRSDMKGEQA